MNLKTQIAIVVRAVWLCFRFNPSPDDVEEKTYSSATSSFFT